MGQSNGTAGEARRRPFSEPREIALSYVDAIVNPSPDSVHPQLLAAKVKSGSNDGNAVILALIELLQDADPVRKLGAAALLLTGRADAKAVPVFLDVLRGGDPDLRLRAFSFLVFMDRVPEAMKPLLLELMEDEDRMVRVAAAATLRTLPESFRELRAGLYADNPGIVMMAASALGRAGKWTDRAVEALLGQLERAEAPEARFGIVCILSGMKERAKKAGPALLRLLSDPSTEPGIRRAILLALGEMGLGDEATAALLEAVRSGDSATICAAVLSLKELGTVPEEVLQILIAMLESTDIDDRGAAAWMLGEIGPQAAPAIPRLVSSIISESDPSLCQLLANVIQAIGTSSLEYHPSIAGYAVPALIERARKERRVELIRMFAAVVASFGEFAVPALVDLARGGDVDARIAVATFAKMGEAAAVAVAETLLADEDGQVREIGAAALAEMGPHARPAIPTLIGLLDAGDEDILPDVLRALRALGPEAQMAATALIGILLGENPFLITWAASTLLAIGPGAAKTLREAFAVADEEGKKRLKEILDRLGEPSSRLEGIEVVRDKALLIRGPLDTFRRVGEICKARGVDRFSFTEMQTALGMDDSTIQNQLTEVSAFFREYFAKFEGSGEVRPDNDAAEESRKIFDRRGGKKPTICRPLGWRAWELTDRFLRDQDEAIAARRRRPGQSG